MNCFSSGYLLFETVQFKLMAICIFLCCVIVQVISAAVDLGSSTNAQHSATAVYISESVCSVVDSVCLTDNQSVVHLHSIGSEVNPCTDRGVTAHHEIEESDNNVGIVSKDNHTGEVDKDVEDSMSSEVDSLFETTLEYSICSDLQGSKIANACETKPTMECGVRSATEPVIGLEKTPVADIRTDSAVTDGLQKPVDLLSMSNNVNVDLRNNSTVCSPPTLMVVWQTHLGGL